MVSFFGLKFGGTKVKKIDKNATPNGPPRPRLDLLDDEDQPYDGYNTPSTSRPGTAHGMAPPRGPYANNTAAKSMQNITKHTKNNPSFASLRPANSDANLRKTFANSSATDLAKPPAIGADHRPRSSSLAEKGDARGSVGPKPRFSVGTGGRRPSAPAITLPPPGPPPTTSIPPAPTSPPAHSAAKSPLGKYHLSLHLPNDSESLLPDKLENSESQDQRTSPELVASRKDSITSLSSQINSPTGRPHGTASRKDSITSEWSRPDSDASTIPSVHGGAGRPPRISSRKISVTTNNVRSSGASSVYSVPSPTRMSTGTRRESSEESTDRRKTSNNHQYQLSLSTQNEDENEDRYRLSKSSKHDSEMQADIASAPLPVIEPLRLQTAGVDPVPQQSPLPKDESPRHSNKDIEQPLISPTKSVSPPLPSPAKFEPPPPLPNTSSQDGSAPSTPVISAMEPRAAPLPPTSPPFHTDERTDAGADVSHSPTGFWGSRLSRRKEEKKRKKEDEKRKKEQKKAAKEGRSIISAPIPISVPEAAAAAPSLPSPALPAHNGSIQVHPSPPRHGTPVTRGRASPVARTMSPAVSRTMSPVPGRVDSPATVRTTSPPTVRSFSTTTTIPSRMDSSSTAPRTMSPITTGTLSPALQSPSITSKVSPTPSNESPDRNPTDTSSTDPNNFPLPLPPTSPPIHSPSLKQDSFQPPRPQRSESMSHIKPEFSAEHNPEAKEESASRNDDELEDVNNEAESKPIHPNSRYSFDPVPALEAQGSTEVLPSQQEDLQAQDPDPIMERRSSEALPSSRMHAFEPERQRFNGESRGSQGPEPVNRRHFDDPGSKSPALRDSSPHHDIEEFGMNRGESGFRFDGQHPYEIPLPLSPTVISPGPRFDEFSPRPSLDDGMEDYQVDHRNFNTGPSQQDHDHSLYGHNGYSDYHEAGYRPRPPPVPVPYVPPDRGYKAFVPGAAVPDDRDVTHLVTATKLRESRKFDFLPKIGFSNPFPPPLKPRERAESTSSFGAGWATASDSPSQSRRSKPFAAGASADRGSPTPLGKPNSRSPGPHEVRTNDFFDAMPSHVGQRDQASSTLSWTQDVRRSDFSVNSSQALRSPITSPITSPHAQDFPPSSFGRVKDQYPPGWDVRTEDFSVAPPTGNSGFSGMSGRMDPGQTPTVRTFGAAVTEASSSTRDSMVPSMIDEGEDEYGDGDSYMGSSLHSSFIDSYMHSWNGDLDKEYRERYPEGIEHHLGIADGGNEPTPDQTPRPEDNNRWGHGNGNATNLDTQDDDGLQFNMDANWPLPAPPRPKDIEERPQEHPTGLETHNAGFNGEKTKKRPPPLNFESGTTTGKSRWNRLDDEDAKSAPVGLGLEVGMGNTFGSVTPMTPRSMRPRPMDQVEPEERRFF